MQRLTVVFILQGLALHHLCKQCLSIVSGWWSISLQLDSAHWLPLINLALLAWICSPFLGYSRWIRQRSHMSRVFCFLPIQLNSSLPGTWCIDWYLCKLNLNPFQVRTTAFSRREWNINSPPAPLFFFFLPALSLWHIVFVICCTCKGKDMLYWTDVAFSQGHDTSLSWIQIALNSRTNETSFPFPFPIWNYWAC